MRDAEFFAKKNHRPFLIFFKSDFCSYCKFLDVAIGVIGSKYKARLDVFVLDVNDEKEVVKKLFKKYTSGVPSVILFYQNRIIPIEEPEQPDPYMWYSLSYLESFINRFLGENNE